MVRARVVRGDPRWEQRKALEGSASTCPFFIGSVNDIDLAVFHGSEPLEQFHRYYSDVRDVRIVGGAAGHMLQMGSPDEVSAAMVEFLTRL